MADTDDVPLVSIHGEVERSADVKVEKVSVDGGSIAKLGAVASLGGLLFGFGGLCVVVLGLDRIF